MSVKKRDGAENTTYWDFVEKTARDVRARRPSWSCVSVTIGPGYADHIDLERAADVERVSKQADSATAEPEDPPIPPS